MLVDKRAHQTSPESIKNLGNSHDESVKLTFNPDSSYGKIDIHTPVLSTDSEVDKTVLQKCYQIFF